MKKLLMLTLLIAIHLNMVAHEKENNPFAKFNYKVKIATFDDKEEFHDKDRIVEINSVLFDTKLNQVVGYAQEKDSLVELVPDMTSTSIDPLCEKYYSISPYAYCLNNPVRYIDPDGRSTWVMNNDDGTYRVVGGDLDDNDKKIYVYSIQDGQLVRGESIGESLTLYSFFDDNGKAVTGATIGPDPSGLDFINNEIIAGDPGLLNYMYNATGGKDYDFKTRGLMEGASETSRMQYLYRGMPFKDADNNVVFASARDIGNYAAGYIAGRKGLDWKTARLGFDILESFQNAELSSEGMTTISAQRLGYNIGTEKYRLRSVSNYMKKLFNRPTSIPPGFDNF